MPLGPDSQLEIEGTVTETIKDDIRRRIGEDIRMFSTDAKQHRSHFLRIAPVGYSQRNVDAGVPQFEEEVRDQTHSSHPRPLKTDHK